MIASLIAFTLSQTVPQEAPTPPPACNTAEHAKFDFWVGEWDVFPNGSDTQVARSKIERLYAGCAIRENWMPLQGAGGGSLNSFDPKTGRWHQTWIGGSPGRVEFVGGAIEGGMVLQGYWNNIGGPGKNGLVKMTYTLREDGSVRQYGQVSFDHGTNWADSFDLIYRPKPTAKPKDDE